MDLKRDHGADCAAAAGPLAATGELPADRESARLAALERYDVLDTPREEAFDRITRLAQKIFRAPIATVTLVDGHRQWFKSQIGLDACETPREPAFCMATAVRGAPLIVTDAAQDPDYAENPFVVGAPHIRFYAGAPLLTHDGHAIGSLCVIDREPRSFSEEETSMLVDLAAIVMDELELRLLADQDALTGALSRRAFRDEAARMLALAARHDQELSVVMIDVDHFKKVNDVHGHAVGDVVLARTVAACVGELRSSDVIGRLGGEEFAALLPHAGAKRALEVAERLRAAIAAESYVSDAGDFTVTASFGVATRHRGSDVDGMLQAADAALYQAKSQGRDRCVLSSVLHSAIGGPRRRVFAGGRLYYDRRSASRSCTVRTLSDRGAGVDVSSASGLPAQLELAIEEEDGFPKACRLVRWTERHVEVEFV